jgi:predicted transcriptional regulator
MTCTYRFVGTDGKQTVIKGQAAFKAFLADGGLEQFNIKVPEAPSFQRRQGKVLERIPELEAAAQGLKEGTVTREQYEKLVNKLKPVTPYAEVPTPATTADMERGLTSDKVERIGVPMDTLKAGDPVGLRLDIPAYANHGVWVVSVHEQEAGYAAGKSIGYESVAAVTKPTFGVVEKAAMAIAGGKPKATIAVMKGDWKPVTPKQASTAAKAALKSGNWVQVGMDPTRHAYFYDRANMEPVVSADEAIQIGPLVLAKNPVYGKKSDFAFSRRQAGAEMMGINVNQDGDNAYADKIIDGEKTIETRASDSLRPYVGKRVAIVRTGAGPAKAIGEVTIGEPIVVKTQKEFDSYRDQTLVPKGSKFDIAPGGVKYLYPLSNPIRYKQERDVGAGIVARRIVEPKLSRRQPMGRATEGWILSRDEVGRFRFGAGAKAYRYAADVANLVLDKLGLKPVSPELGRAMRKMKAEIERAQRLTVTVAEKMKELPEQERQMISDVIEGELKRGTKPPKHVLELAASLQSIMSEQSAELVRLGMLSPEAAGRWDGKYLPRFYEQKLGDEVKAWAKAAKALLGRKKTMQGIGGSSLKSRGMFELINTEDLQDWLDEGWEVRDAEFDPATDETVMVWRDYTRQERDDMGEIRDAMFRFVMGYNKSQRDIALGRLYESLADNYASKKEKPGYVKVPDTKIEDTMARRYGKLAGKWVPAEVMDHLSAFDDSQRADQDVPEGLVHVEGGQDRLEPGIACEQRPVEPDHGALCRHLLLGHRQVRRRDARPDQENADGRGGR